MALRGRVAAFALAGLAGGAAAETPPAQGTAQVVWVPVMLPAAGPYFLPPPMVWWLQAIRPVPAAASIPVAEVPAAAPPAPPALVTEPPAPARPVARKAKPKRTAPAKAKPRRLCWKDNVLSACP